MQGARRLIFDIGMHNGDDTEFYLAKGFNVVAVEANPELVEAGKQRFAEPIAAGQLTIVQKAIADRQGTVTLYVNPGHTDWSSIYKDIATRDGVEVQEVQAQAVTITDLFREYGVPYYAKIDIEKADRDALMQMSRTTERPRFVSVEAHDISYLTYLRDMGYNRFKVVNQANYWWFKCPAEALEGEALPEWKFTIHSSGPFGEETPGRWLDFESAAYLYLQARQISVENDFMLNQWMDFHAAA
ncbi:FkbM family methyltransferase [Microvirga sp. 3-52]|uniref:FkbM family methyltransferase n=1 Tax=Microvirga sp. 3-52 TaxID=2792425 RepID=UPI001AC25DEA|nr:FkbM family methyltransferase [Microvirga sp. 3-52]MBO1905773.1 FkbM family methyltransferase [Microvirga sp. 3-52]MBS7453130.1 FkbM family methyltransferase [Microvirga sp. 3-52]